MGTMIKRRIALTRQHIDEKKASRFILNPRKYPKLTWDALNVTILMASLGEIFYSLAFTADSCEWTYLAKIELFVDIFFLSDCVLNFFTSYEDFQTGYEVADHSRIARNYLCGWFFLDAISSFPFNRAVCASSSTDKSSNQVRTRLLKVLRLVKATRFLRMLRTAARLEEELGHLFHNSVRFIKFFCLMALFIHLCACMWFGTIEYAACQIPQADPVVSYAPCGCEDGEDCRDWNWLIKYSGGQDQYDLFIQNKSAYMMSLYYSTVTLTTLGYGDITPSNDVEQVVAAMLSLSGGIMFSILIGSMGTLITKGNVITRSMEENILKFVDLCRFKTMPSSFEKKIRKQVDYIMIKAPHRFIEIDLLPREMQDQILEKIGHDLFGNIEFFKYLDADYRARLVSLLRPCKYTQGESIFKAKEVSTEMYWVVRGEVSIVRDASGDNPHHGTDSTEVDRTDSAHAQAGKDPVVDSHGVSLSEDGSMFGEVEMFPAEELDRKLHAHFGCNYESVYSHFRMYSAVAKSRCELLELKKVDLHGDIKTYMPDLYEAILNHAAHRALSYRAELPKHEREMSERFRARQLQWQKLGAYEARLNRMMALANTPLRSSSNRVVSDLVVSNGLAGDPQAPPFEDQRRTLKQAAGTFGVMSFGHRQPNGAAGKYLGGDEEISGGRGAELREIRNEMREMKAQLSQILAALGCRPADAAGGVVGAVDDKPEETNVVLGTAPAYQLYQGIV